MNDDEQTASSPGVRIRRIEQHTDPRGTAFEPLDADALADQRNCHVVLTEPGAVRGNHVHRRSTEILVIRGPALVRYRWKDADHEVAVEPGAVVSFTVPPGVPHAVQNTGTEPLLLVAFRDRPHDPDDPDVERLPLIE